MKKQISLLILFILSGFILSREALADTIPTMLSDVDYCARIPTCEEYGYIKEPSDCGDIPHIKCPMDKNKVFCPFDCASYPLDGCNDSIGECEECPAERKWRYTSCIDNYSLYNGVCTPQDCGDGTFKAYDNPNLTIADESQIEYCWKGGEKYFRYRGCKHGWKFDADNYRCEMITDCNKDSKKNGKNYVDLAGKVCPHNANCDDVCYEFNESTKKATAKTNIVCDSSQDLRLQPAGDISGEGYKCRKHPVGNIAFYCKNVSEIPEGLDLDGDQIISLAADDYDSRPNGCEAIGVVFDNDGGKTKIVGLKNIGYSPLEVGFTEGKFNDVGSAQWSTSSQDVRGLVSVEIEQGGYAWSERNQIIHSMAVDGKLNTDAILSWVQYSGYKAPAAQATKSYYPRLYDSDTDYYITICGEGTVCGVGNWYLPSMSELVKLRSRLGSASKLVEKAFSEIEDKNDNLGWKLKCDSGIYIFSSNEVIFPGNQSIGAGLIRCDGPYVQRTEKTGSFYVRPVLAIDD